MCTIACSSLSHARGTKRLVCPDSHSTSCTHAPLSNSSPRTSQPTCTRASLCSWCSCSQLQRRRLRTTVRTTQRSRSTHVPTCRSRMAVQQRKQLQHKTCRVHLCRSRICDRRATALSRKATQRPLLRPSSPQVKATQRLRPALLQIKAPVIVKAAMPRLPELCVQPPKPV